MSKYREKQYLEMCVEDLATLEKMLAENAAKMSTAAIMFASVQVSITRKEIAFCEAVQGLDPIPVPTEIG